MTAPVVDLATLPSMPFDELSALPSESGIYFAVAEDDAILYIGRTVNFSLGSTPNRTQVSN